MRTIFTGLKRQAFAASRRGGFTLLELLVVVMILGILTAVAVPQYGRSVRRAEMVEGLTHGKSIFDSALRYKAVNGEAPTNFNQLDVGFMGTNINGEAFNDGNFTYTLYNTYVAAKNNKSGYILQMRFPLVSDTGVDVSIYCCAGNTADDDGKWLCNNSSQEMINGCI